MMKLQCKICFQNYEERSTFMAHMRIHQLFKQLTLPIQCNMLGCNRTFIDLKTMNEHLKDVHEKNDSVFILNKRKDENDDENEVHMETNNYDDYKGAEEIDFIRGNDENNTENQNNEKINQKVADIILNKYNKEYLSQGFSNVNDINIESMLLFSCIKTKHQISDAALTFIINVFNGFIKRFSIFLQSKMIETFFENEITNKASDFLGFCDSIQSPFDFIKSTYKQNQLLESSDTYVAPISIQIGKRIDTGQKKNEAHIKVKNLTFEYISISKTLESVLRNTTITDIIENNDILETGDYHNDHELFKNKNNLRLIFYYDELELCNPLGDVANVYKVAMFYFTISNLTRKYNSALRNVFLVAIAFSEDLKAHGINTVLNHVVEDVKMLETNGIIIDTRTYYASISQVVGDNLGIHELFGLRMSFNGEYLCYKCNASKDSIQKHHLESDFIINTHETKQKLIDDGLMKPCVLNELKYFNETCNYAFDITHDLWEGVVPYELSLLFEQIIFEDELFGKNGLDFLNQRIHSFNYGPKDAVNKPSLIKLKSSKKIKIKEKAAKCCCLFRMLPFLIGDKIPDEYSFWNLYLILSKIVDIIYTQGISGGQTDELNWLVQEHHFMYKQLYPNSTLKKKHHNMVHYGTAIRRLGCLVDYSTIRFEGKHSYFKNAHRISHNYINIPKTISKKHQVNISLNLLSSKIYKTEIDIHNGHEIAFVNLKTEIQSFLNQLDGFNEDENIILAESVEYFGLKYCKNLVVTKNNNLSVSSFYCIDKILVFKV